VLDLYPVRSPHSAIRRLQSMFYTDRNPTILDRLYRHKRCLFRRYARRRAFITKTRTIILFMNTAWNRLASEEKTRGKVHVEYYKVVINAARDVL